MRLDFLNILEQSEARYQIIMSNFGKTMPNELLSGAKTVISSDMVIHINDVINIINMNEGSPIYPNVSNVEDAKILFSNAALDNSIQNAIISSKVNFLDENEVTRSSSDALNRKLEQMQICLNQLIDLTNLGDLNNLFP